MKTITKISVIRFLRSMTKVALAWMLTFLAGRAWAIPLGFNVDPTSGALIGWTATAIDGLGDPVVPLITVVQVAGEIEVQLITGSYNNGPFISTLGRSFTVNPAESFLSFSFSLPYVASNPTGAGTSPSSDTFVVSLFDGLHTSSLLLLDKSGALPDPFGTAPGTIALGPMSGSPYDYMLTADLSSLAGQSISLYIDAINVDDGFVSTATFGSVETHTSPTKVPDAGGTAWLLLLSLGLLSIQFRFVKSRR